MSTQTNTESKDIHTDLDAALEHCRLVTQKMVTDPNLSENHEAHYKAMLAAHVAVRELLNSIDESKLTSLQLKIKNGLKTFDAPSVLGSAIALVMFIKPEDRAKLLVKRTDVAEQAA